MYDPALHFLDAEAAALAERLRQVAPLSGTETMVPAAVPVGGTLGRVDALLGDERRRLIALVAHFRTLLTHPATRPDRAQLAFATVRARFNVLLGELDLFADALSQRSERVTGLRLAGLDEAARDLLSLPDQPYASPPVLTWLDRGRGGAIRRARTRLPTGRENPVALIRLPRERMIGAGIASSLAHEVGHQGAALLGLVPDLTAALERQASRAGLEGVAWRCWSRWVSEVLADLWAVGRVGAAATTGLVGVVSLPRRFVFHVSIDDPHPAPWIRVLASASLGARLYPDAQWSALADVWRRLYPLGASPHREMLLALEATLPALGAILTEHRPPRLEGRTLGAALTEPAHAIPTLRGLARGLAQGRVRLDRMPPRTAFAVVGQGRADGVLPAEIEGARLDAQIRRWAFTAARREALRDPSARAA